MSAKEMLDTKKLAQAFVYRLLRGVRRLASLGKRTGFAPMSGVHLPPLSHRQGGAHFARDISFIESAKDEALRLADVVESRRPLRVLDLGCGSGRLAIGLLEAQVPIRHYVGIDVQSHHIEWCRDAIVTRFPHFQFYAVDAANPRYNPAGSQSVAWPVPDSGFHVVYAYSVFSHMSGRDVAANLEEAYRVLGDHGLVVATAFLEEDCPPETENPDDYGPLRWAGPLHCVRFERGYFEAIARGSGFSLRHLVAHSATDGQSLVVLCKRDANQLEAY